MFPEKVSHTFTEYGKSRGNECEIDCESCSNCNACLKITDTRTDVEYRMDLIAFDMAWWETVLMDEQNPDTIADAIVKLIACQLQLDCLDAKRCATA